MPASMHIHEDAIVTLKSHLSQHQWTWGPGSWWAWMSTSFPLARGTTRHLPCLQWAISTQYSCTCTSHYLWRAGVGLRRWMSTALLRGTAWELPCLQWAIKFAFSLWTCKIGEVTSNRHHNVYTQLFLVPFADGYHRIKGTYVSRRKIPSNITVWGK